MSLPVRFVLSALLTSAASCVHAAAAPASPVDWVNAYIGTQGDGSEYGGTMPLVTAPFGMTNWTAQTRQNRISVSSYEYDDTTISGFIGTHQPAIWMGDFGYVTLMPEIGEIKMAPDSRKLAFAHADEIATPYYYSVKLQTKSGDTILSELTATQFCSYLRFTFPRAGEGSVYVEGTRLNIRGEIAVDAARHEIAGYNPDRMDAHLGPLKLPNFKGYFVVRFKRAFHDAHAVDGVRSLPGELQADNANAGAYATFDTRADNVVEVQVGTSFISLDEARAHLDAELPSWDFDATRAKLKKTWNDKLGLIAIDGAGDDERHIFYTGLYHALLYPRSMSERGRYYSGFDDRVHSGTSYTAFSIWDTFRAENSLLTLIAPERIDGMIQALLQDFREGGWMPKWPNPSYTNIMIGTHADSLVAEAIAKGFTGFDRKLAYAAVRKDAMTPPDEDATRHWYDGEPATPYEARAGLSWFKRLGYIPADKTSESASSMLEDTYDDYAVAQVAKAVGEAQDHRFFLERSRAYRNIFNPATGFMQAKNSDGTWAAPGEGWTEGDQWVYLFAPLHDIAGVMALLGGEAAFVARLDEHFAGGHNKHDNEPSHHYGYLYDYAGVPSKTQARVRALARAAYANTPTGILGNEDCGQMSAWYIFTAMGFYPVNPASAEYMIGSPLFSRTTLNLRNGRRFEISAAGNSAQNVYIQSATLNGRRLDKPVITHAQIEAGGSLAFVMGPAPSNWASSWRSMPIGTR
ncbi:MAG: GH92 family glycosyl hydrolase [Rudaea sp.]